MQKKKLNRKIGIWEKRFKKTLHKKILDFTSSVNEDEYLIPYDLTATRAHVMMLRKTRILNDREYKECDRILRVLGRRYWRGKFSCDKRLEDVHMNVEAKIQRLSHAAGSKVHTARSRNDLVATDLRMYCRDAIVWLIEVLSSLQAKILRNAAKYEEVIVPAYTHLQSAEPILWSYYMCAQFFKFQRDIEGLLDLRKRTDVSVMGCCACAGTSHAIEPSYTAKILAFSRFCDNCLDGVTDRDFMSELMYYCTQIALHLASLAEDLIIYSTQEFAMVDFKENVVTGSSIMPQKKNPDMCELLRGRAGQALGHLVAALSMLKGLPSSYNRDLQSAKKVFLEEVDESITALKVARIVVDATQVRQISDAQKPHWNCSTNLVDFLVRNGWAFRRAYNLVAQCVKDSNSDVSKFASLCASRTGHQITEINEQLKPCTAIKNKCSSGSTGITQTRKQLEKARQLLKRNQRNVKSLKRLVIKNRLLALSFS